MKQKLLKWFQLKLGITSLKIKLHQQQVIIDRLIGTLGEETIIGADVHMKSSSFVIIFTRAAGGQIRFMDIEIKSMIDLKRLTHFLQKAYGITERDMFLDLPPGFPPRREWRDY